jgi:hypothetical protein
MGLRDFGFIRNCSTVRQQIMHPLVSSSGGYFAAAPGGAIKATGSTVAFEPGQAVKLPIGLFRVALRQEWAKPIEEAEFDALMTPAAPPVIQPPALEQMTRKQLDVVAAGLGIDTAKMLSKGKVLEAIQAKAEVEAG